MQLGTTFFDLIVHEVLCVTQNSKSSDIGSGMGVVFRHDFRSESIQFGHGSNCLVHHYLGLRYRNKAIAVVVFKDLVPKSVVSCLFVLLSPFVHVHGDLRPQGFCKNQDISNLGAVGTHVFIPRHDGRRNTSNNWPGVQNSLSTRHRSSSLGARVPKPANHQVGADRSFVDWHVPRGRQQHKNEVTLLNALGIEIRQDVCGTDSPL
mmetsp:Transcript_15066/g.37963  ORF Transcript_15066/g.37963 Transcript_15066/m.37963 type:complete len:206 (+) Transcript_15066:612-1229(+)